MVSKVIKKEPTGEGAGCMCMGPAPAKITNPVFGGTCQATVHVIRYVILLGELVGVPHSSHTFFSTEASEPSVDVCKS